MNTETQAPKHLRFHMHTHSCYHHMGQREDHEYRKIEHNVRKIFAAHKQRQGQVLTDPSIERHSEFR